MTTEEEMAVAVLRGDRAAALALADLLQETSAGVRVPPVKTLTANADRLRVVLFYDDHRGLVVDQRVREHVAREIRSWLRDGMTLMLPGAFSRIELYELPPRPYGLKPGEELT